MENNAKQLKRLLDKHNTKRVGDIKSYIDRKLALIYQKAAYETSKGLDFDNAVEIDF